MLPHVKYLHLFVSIRFILETYLNIFPGKKFDPFLWPQHTPKIIINHEYKLHVPKDASTQDSAFLANCF